MRRNYFVIENRTLIREVLDDDTHDLQRWDNGVWKSDAPALARYFFLGEGQRDPITKKAIIDRFGRDTLG